MAVVTRAKRKLGEVLAKMRDDAGKSLLEAATALRTTDSSLSRYEQGKVLASWVTVEALSNYYEASVEDASEAETWWRKAKDEPARMRLPRGASKSFRSLVQAELEADRIRALEMSLVPGLLQTESYVRAVLAAAPHFREPNARIESYVSARLNRQKRLDDESLRLHALVDEAVIEREIGGVDVQRAQLEHLLAAMDRPNITLQLIAKSAGAYGTMSGPFTIISYPDADEPAGLYLEFPNGGAWVEDDEVQPFIATFDDITQIAMSLSETAARIGQQIEVLERK